MEPNIIPVNIAPMMLIHSLMAVRVGDNIITRQFQISKD
jgi:hypothetical protein